VLERIAQALEIIVLHQYKVRLGSCAQAIEDPNPSEDPTLEYEDDLSSLKQMLQAIHDGRSIDRPIGDE